MKKNMYYFNFGLPASSGEGLDTNLRGGKSVKDGACEHEAFTVRVLACLRTFFILDAQWCNLRPIRGLIYEQNRKISLKSLSSRIKAFCILEILEFSLEES